MSSSSSVSVSSSSSLSSSSYVPVSSSSSLSSSSSGSTDVPAVIQSNTDYLYEQELLRDPYRVKIWMSYLNSKPKAYDPTVKYSMAQAQEVAEWRRSVYERALQSMPGSYKLWLNYLQECVRMVQPLLGSSAPSSLLPLSSSASLLPPLLASQIAAAHDNQYLPNTFYTFLATSVLMKKSAMLPSSASTVPASTIPPLSPALVNDLFERCLIHHCRRPRIWLLYCSFLRSQKCITRTRRTFDRCLRSIPITQHDLIWEAALEFVRSSDVEETAVKLYRRCVMVCPDKVEEFVDFLQEKERWDEAAALLAKSINDDRFVSSRSKTKHQLWMELCDMLTAHPESIKSISVEEVLRCGLMKFVEEVGKLWCSLADHFIRLGQFERARDVYEEGIVSVSTLHDFALVFDAYAAFEENLVAAKLEEEQEHGGSDTAEHRVEVDLYIRRLERLMDRRPELVSSVKLRQNPHNVNEWLHRVHLFRETPLKVVETFSDAVRTIDPGKAVGRFPVIWCRFSRYYEEYDDLPNARAIFQKASNVPFRGIDDLASIWCEWVEMELRHKQYGPALQTARQALVKPHNVDPDSAQARLFRSVKLWSMVADVEESLGTLDTVRVCYDKMFALKVITPQLVINFAQYLHELRYFEESFKVYERGIALFNWPHLNDIYLIYLTSVVQRFGSTKLERARELFEQAVREVPPKFARRLYLSYARLEEECGLAKHALRIYEKACNAVTDAQKFDMFVLYIAKTADLFGVTKTRRIYEQAIEQLPDAQAKTICLQYAQVEKGLGEIDRSRSIYTHASQFSDPSKDPEFWREWREFEVSHGNEESFRDMLRVKRSVQAQYSQVHFNAAELVAETAPQALDPMAAAEAQLAQQQ
eukprot:GHVS01022595.1.p1 GENE.GHVS01022595.1~~GHVS01022595.1.p1  ORF type:complete len:872 (+),score=97.66 GHVS01022595.1:29-2644(+)